MSALQKRYRIRGLGMERLLDSLQKAGINLYDIRRDPGHSVTFSCDASKAAQVETAAQSLGFAWEALPPKGWRAGWQPFARVSDCGAWR